MNVSAAAEPGRHARPNEDWHYADPNLIVVLDGATVRTDTGCEHGVTWYVDKLGTALVDTLTETPRVMLSGALRQAIATVAAMHPQCDLTHPGTPSAGVGIVVDLGDRLHWLVLGDVTVAVDTGDHIETMVDDRVSHTAAEARAEADRYAIGSEAKERALVEMKRGELAARNTPDGYWIAAADPAAADHALTGTITGWQRVAVLTDGAARIEAFGLMAWNDALSLLSQGGPTGLIRAVRQAERGDPTGEHWPRNKKSDDATAVYATPRRIGYAVGDRVRSQWDPDLRGMVTSAERQTNLGVRWDWSPVEVDMPAHELRAEPVSRGGSPRILT